MERQIIGRTDKIDFPQFGIYDIQAKIDTGAYTSSIHCTHIKLKGETLEFHIPGLKKDKNKTYATQNFTQKSIRSSNGKVELRFVIKTQVILFDKLITGDFSLSNRASMKNPVLLGRKILKNRFLVDVTKKDLSFKAKQL